LLRERVLWCKFGVSGRRYWPKEFELPEEAADGHGAGCFDSYISDRIHGIPTAAGRSMGIYAQSNQLEVFMSAEIWAAYSVRDHLKPNAFLADVVMYDHLVVPEPPADEPEEWGHWEGNLWEPGKQREFLDVLGPVVTRVPWTRTRRDVWERDYSRSRSETSLWLRRSLAFEMTADGLFDVVPAMAQPVVATTPYTSLDDLTHDLQITRTEPDSRLPASIVSAVVGREIMVPSDSSRSEMDLLKEAVKVTTTNDDYRNARAALHTRLGDFSRDGFTDLDSLRAAVKAINQDLEDMERAVRNRRIWVRAHRVFSFSQIVFGVLAAPFNPFSVGLVVTGIGEWTTSEFLSDSTNSARKAPDIALLLDVKHELRLG
jgi:hypothetical protein